MQIPIYLDGREAGALTITERGPMTELTAQLDGVSQVVRLTVYGSDGESFYLGVPEPKEGGMILVRRITPAERKRLPEHPSYAAEKPVDIQPERKTPRRILWLGGKAYPF